jgi:hypothetical protein
MDMERKGSIAAGFASLSHGKLILLLTLTAVVLGALGAAPLLPAFHDKLGGTLAGDHFIRNHPTFAPSDFFDFLFEQEYAIKGARRTALAAGILGVLLQVFFAGGIVAVLHRGPFTFGQFLEPSRRNFWHNLKCLVLFGISGGAVLGLWFGGLGFATKKLLEDVPPDARVRSAVWWLTLIGGTLLFAAVSLLYDFARAARRYAPTIGAWRGYRFARRALSGSWIRAILLFLFWLLVGGGVVLALFAATWLMPAVSAPAVAVLFLLQLAVLWTRSAARVAAWGSYLSFLDARARKALSAMSRPRFSAVAAASSAV